MNTTRGCWVATVATAEREAVSARAWLARVARTEGSIIREFVNILGSRLRHLGRVVLVHPVSRAGQDPRLTLKLRDLVDGEWR